MLCTRDTLPLATPSSSQVSPTSTTTRRSRGPTITPPTTRRPAVVLCPGDRRRRSQVKKPIAAYVEKVYDEGNFASLGI